MSFHVELVTPNSKFSIDAKVVVLPGELGQFGVLKHHAKIISKLSDGIISIDNQKKYHIISGFAHVCDNGRLIITAENVESI